MPITSIQQYIVDTITVPEGVETQLIEKSTLRITGVPDVTWFRALADLFKDGALIKRVIAPELRDQLVSEVQAIEFQQLASIDLDNESRQLDRLAEYIQALNSVFSADSELLEVRLIEPLGDVVTQQRVNVLFAEMKTRGIDSSVLTRTSAVSTQQGQKGEPVIRFVVGTKSS